MHGSTHQGSYLTWNASTQHQHRRWPDLSKSWKTLLHNLKENTIVSPLPSYGSPRHLPCLFHIPARGLHVGRYTPQLFSVLGRAPTLSPSFLLAQTIFELNLFLYKYPKHFLNLVIFHTYLPMKMDQCFPKTRHIIFRGRGITQKKAYSYIFFIQFWNTLGLCIHINVRD
jgi:hypothetical protein